MKKGKFIYTYFLVSIIGVFLTFSCVSPRKYNDALNDIARLKVDSTLQANKMATINYDKTSELIKREQKLRNMEDRLDSLINLIEKQKSAMQNTYFSLKEIFPELRNNDLETYVEDGYLHVSLAHNILFNQSEDDLSDEGKSVIADITNRLVGIDTDIMIVGHTDNVPYESDRMNNWELSFNRAHAVMQVMVNAGYPQDQIILAGRGKTDPDLKNKTQIGRFLNRRIELVLMPDFDQIEYLYSTILKL